MRKITIFLFILLIGSLTACQAASPTKLNGASQQPATEAPPQPTATQPAAPTLSPEEIGKQLHTYMETNQYTLAYPLALELLEADPTDANLYIIAVDALLGMSRANYAEASELLAQAQVQAQDQQALADWYQSLQSTLSLEVPYLADYLSPDEINTYGNLSGNLINGERKGGQMAFQGSWLYFANYADNGFLYKYNPQSGKLIKLSDDAAAFINIVGNWLFYANLNEGNALYKLKSDGSARERIGEESGEYLFVLNDWLYYANLNDDSSLYKIQTDGSQKTKLSSDMVKYVSLTGDWIYYHNKSEGGQLYRIQTDGSQRSAVAEDNLSIIDGDFLYALNLETLQIFRENLDASEPTLVYDAQGNKISTFNVSGNRLAVSIREGDRDKLILINLETGMKELEVDIWTEKLFFGPNQEIYFFNAFEGDILTHWNLTNGALEPIR